MKILHEGDVVDYRLNLLGIRLSKGTAQLIAKYGVSEWTTLGPARALPLHIPQTSAELKAAGQDALLLTAYQYEAEIPESDLRKAFELAGNARPELKMAAGGAIPV